MESKVNDDTVEPSCSINKQLDEQHVSSSNAEEDESWPLLRNKESEYIVYTRRWWILAVFSFSCFMQSLIWNTIGPIAQSAKVVYEWDNDVIGMIPNVNNMAYIATAFIAAYYMDVKGLRISALFCSGLLLLSAGLRCLSSDPLYVTWLMYGSQLLDGIAGTVFYSGPALLTSLWFPPHQRATATAISSSFNFVGIAGGFLIGPLLVSAPVFNTTTEVVQEKVQEWTTALPYESSSYEFDTARNLTEVTNFSQLREEITWLMYYECIAAGVGFIATVVYFPDKPPVPPSKSANLQRTEFKKGILKMLRNGPLWLLFLAFSLPIGVYGSWSTVLDVILDPVGLTQIEAGWMGFYATIGGCLAGCIVARFSDIFMRHMKLFLVVLYFLGGASTVWFTLICEKMLPFSVDQLYIASILGGIFLNAAIPLFLELGCETSYPVGEGITGAVLTLGDCIFGVVFYLGLQIPSLGTSWMNWALVGSIGAGLLFLFLFPESYKRTELDITINVKQSQEAVYKDA